MGRRGEVKLVVGDRRAYQFAWRSMSSQLAVPDCTNGAIYLRIRVRRRMTFDKEVDKHSTILNILLNYL